MEKSLALLQKANREFLERAGCQSCHNATFPTLAIGLAGELGFAFDRDMARTNAAVTKSSIASGFEKAVQMMDPDGGSPTSTSYALIILDSPADTATHATPSGISRPGSLPDGRWRPPSTFVIRWEATTMTATRDLDAGGSNSTRPKAKERVTRSRFAKRRSGCPRSNSRTTEQRTFQLLGLTWAKAEAAQRQKRAGGSLERAASGRWLEPIEFVTERCVRHGGSALRSSPRAGMADRHRSDFERGVRFLIQTQQPDGSWHVASRAVRFQQHFETGFPYGKDPIHLGDPLQVGPPWH